MQKLCILLAFFLLAASAAWSQDKIYRKNGKIVEAKILEVGSSEVKYRVISEPDGPIYILETDRISKIVYENGRVEKFADDIRDPERYVGQRNKAIKFDFFAPLLGYAQFSFEKSTGVGKSYEVSLGIIGAGKSAIINYYDYNLEEVKREQFGVFASFGYKFNKLPNFIIFGKTKMAHLMQGTYVKPIVYAGHYKENVIFYKANNTYEIGKQNVTFGAIQLEFGKQWVFGDKVLLDLYWGLGYGFDNKKDSYQYDNGYYDNTAAYNYANARIGESPGLSTTFGLKLGLLIK